jgi:hypothetical protein
MESLDHNRCFQRIRCVVDKLGDCLHDGHILLSLISVLLSWSEQSYTRKAYKTYLISIRLASHLSGFGYDGISIHLDKLCVNSPWPVLLC